MARRREGRGEKQRDRGKGKREEEDGKRRRIVGWDSGGDVDSIHRVV